VISLRAKEIVKSVVVYQPRLEGQSNGAETG